MCAHAVRVAVEKLPGVQQATVSLNEGVAVITFDSTNGVTIDAVRKVVRSNGFTPRGAEVEVRGRLLEQGGQLVLRVPGHERPLALLPDTAAPGLLAELRSAGVNREVTIEAFAPEPARAEEGVDRLLLRSYRFDR